MRTIRDLFDCWNTLDEMADDIGVTAWSTRKWSQRGRIPVAHWDAVVSAASRKGKQVCADDLLVLHGLRRRGAAARASK